MSSSVFPCNSRRRLERCPGFGEMAALGWLQLLACAEGGSQRPRDSQVTTPIIDASTSPSSARDPVRPLWTLGAGARYFERAGVQAPILMRNVSAPSAAAFRPRLAAAAAAGSSVVRVQITQGFGYETLGIDREGNVLPGWASSWDEVLDEAERQGLGVIVVFALWGDWNDGTPALGWTHFDANPLGPIRGGPAASPADLFADTETRRRWLGWMRELVQRWSSRPNVIAWEIFSELDLATGATEASALELVERAQVMIQDIDPWRPSFASTSDLPVISGQPWQSLWLSPANAIVSVHPYAEDLDRALMERVRAVLPHTDKPLLIAESGLDAAAPDGTTLTSGARAEVGLTHAIWAGLFSGAASARAFYWEDSYAAYYPATGLPLVARFDELERAAANWIVEKDFRGLEPASVSGDPALFGTAVAGETRVLGWARADQLGPPEWNAPSLPRGRVEVQLAPNSPEASWQIALTDPETGMQRNVPGSSRADRLTFEVSEAFSSVVFEATRGDGRE